AASQALGGMATKRSGVVSQGERASLAAAEAEDGEVGLPGGGRPAEERDEARASTSRRAEEDAWWQRARKGEEPTRSGMVSASPGEEVEEAPSSAGLQAQGAQRDAMQVTSEKERHSSVRRAGSDFFRFLFFTSDSNLTTTSVEKGGNDCGREDLTLRAERQTR
ncbi:unnamed protein product, partial [Lampetra fluviatilis]